MTLFTILLVMIAERLFKLGEHWQLDHRSEIFFRRIKHFSLLRTLIMTAGVMLVVFLLLRALHGLFLTSLCWWSGFCSACSVLVPGKCVCTTTLT